MELRLYKSATKHKIVPCIQQTGFLLTDPYISTNMCCGVSPI